ncbi:carbohydrate ABC transporter permease [Leifsonia sp. LS-T14]|uniref:carbohydrate ABC transporter permease n=1 Tax=unclassified Leifsonia TaxID=2663824 RepID=UPI0035A63E21
MLLLLAFGLLPALYCVYLAFTDANTGAFVGFENFVAISQDFRFLPSVANVGIYLAVWLIPSTILLVWLAMLLHNRAGKSAAFLRAAYYIPGALAGTASVIVWLFMLTPSVSPLKGGFEAAGLTQIFQVVDPSRLPIVIALISFWTGAGGWVLILYGALTSIDPSLVEAARLDGANEWQMARHVKLPLMRKWIGYLIILNLAAGTQVFVEPQLISTATHGGVATNWAPNQLGYTLAFGYGQFNQSAALSLELLALGLVAAVIIITSTNLFKSDV